MMEFHPHAVAYLDILGFQALCVNQRHLLPYVSIMHLPCDLVKNEYLTT
jgi:hypothetical protein